MARSLEIRVPRLPLSHGQEIPQIGLGTWELKGDECEEVVRTALEMGYRHIDTAEMYENEEAIGRAIADIDRDELFLTSKVWWDNLHKYDVPDACEGSLERLGTEYLDLYLVHWPNAGIPLEETVEAMQRLREDGLIRAWGVSNFTRAHLDDALELDRPAMNQVELHPYLRQEELDRYCRRHNVRLTAYSPLARGEVDEDELLDRIGTRYGKTGAQVALRWSIQHGHVVIPKSSTPRHLATDLDIFDFTLSQEEMERIDGLDEGRRIIEPDFAEFDRAPGA